MHMGANVHVEIDIVLPPEMPLHEAHDIGEGLQHKLERLPEVDRVRRSFCKSKSLCHILTHVVIL